ncbi:MAG: hypothetical protein KDA60_17095 [Planctomycetales bacterium]|nr:hypothetical protein [Planctomycetales bacterium]
MSRRLGIVALKLFLAFNAWLTPQSLVGQQPTDALRTATGGPTPYASTSSATMRLFSGRRGPISG